MAAAISKARTECNDVAAVGSQFREADFETWWHLVTHPEHVRSELEAMPAAWTGSIEHGGSNLAITGVEEGLGFHRRFFQPPTQTTTVPPEVIFLRELIRFEKECEKQPEGDASTT
jgi:hypothetical protein